MCRRCHYAYFNGFLVTGFACRETTLGLIAVMPLDGIANVIREYGYVLHLTYVFFKRSAFDGQWRVAGSHPKFIKHLEDRGLNEWEINYCCLYALGLKGKEIGEYIQLKSHFNNSSDIRKKLGLGEHDVNLGTYIRKLLAE